MVDRTVGGLAGMIALGAILGGCASTCPRGATLRGGPPPLESAQWCERGAATIAAVPAPGRTYEATLGVASPTARGRAVEGPYTEWYPDGRIRAHGSFVLTPAGAPVPDGVWTTWHANGQAESQGRYERGVPVGCFGTWDEGGAVRTFVAADGRLRAERCGVVPDARAERLAARYARAERPRPPLGAEPFSASAGAMLTPSPHRTTSPELTQPTLTVKENARVAFRRRVRWLDVGLTGSVLMTDERHEWSTSAAALASVSIPTAVERVDVELSAEAGVRRYSALPRMGPLRATSSESFVVAYAGAQVAVGVRLTRSLALYTGVLAQRDLARTIERRSGFCDPSWCTGVDASWRVGGSIHGALAELRLLIH